MGDFIVISILAVVVILAIRSIRNSSKKGGCPGSCHCSGSCNGCTGCRESR